MKTVHVLIFIYFLGSCYSSICGTYSLFHSIYNTNLDNNVEWNSLHGVSLWLYNIHWSHEQHGTLQLWAHTKMALHHLSTSQVHHVYALVSLTSLPHSHTKLHIPNWQKCNWYRIYSTISAWCLRAKGLIFHSLYITIYRIYTPGSSNRVHSLFDELHLYIDVIV